MTGVPTISLSSLGFRLCLDTATHPFEYAKFLIQIGHEPIAPYPTKTIFGRPVMGLPNCFKYVQYIKSIDGWRGCYRGCVPKIIGKVVGSFAATSAISSLELDVKPNVSEDMELSEEEKAMLLLSSILKDAVGRTVSVFVSHPFLLISNRMMAQFVGGEDTYSGLFASVVAIFREEGVLGFFRGVLPRWIGELTYVAISSLAIFSINNYIIADNELKSFTTPTISYFTSNLIYPFTVVSSCMSVNDCGLQAGVPPHMPIYRSWWSCKTHLSMSGQLNRGSSPFFRYYFAPPAGQKMLASY